MNALLLLLFGCPTADYTKPVVPPTATYQDPALDLTGASEVFQLHLKPGTYDLPDNSRPKGALTGTRFEVSAEPTDSGWLAKLPFDVGSQGRRFAPPGMVVTVDGNEAPYGKVGVQSWYVKDDGLRLNWPKPPGEIIVDWPYLEDKLARRSFAQANLPAEEFVRWTMTLDDLTRDGILLPAPAAAEWRTTLPAGALFDAHIALDSSPLLTETTDGAVAVLEVVDEAGTVHEVNRQTLPAVSSEFAPFRVDLSQWGGQSVTLRLKSEAGSDSSHDYVFFGSPSVWGDRKGQARRIVVIGLDTTRPDHFGFYGYDKPTSPELDQVAANAAVFTNAWTPAPRTRPSFRSATTGRTPLNAVGATNIGEVFQNQGFATAGIVANVHLQPRFDFNKGFDSWQFNEAKDGNDAEDQIDRALAWMRQHEGRDTYLFLHLMDPHVFYGAPGKWKKQFVPDDAKPIAKSLNRWQVYKRMKQGTLSEGNKAWLEGLYDGEIAYMSHQLGRFFAELDGLGDKTLVVIHSDHGEEFWEHGGYEHNHTLYDDVTRAFFLVRPGVGFEGGARIDVPVTLADIAPTLFDYAGIAKDSWPDLDGRSLRPLIAGEISDDWQRPIGVGHLRYGSESWAVVHDQHKYIVNTATGREELYNLADDPGETANLVGGDVDTTAYHQPLAIAHGMPVATGWRIALNSLRGAEPFTFRTPVAPVGVGVLDPERTVENPTNQAWGEPPKRVCSEIGGVTWDQGSTEFTWTPGTNPRDGVLMVLFEEPPTLDSLVVERSEQPLAPAGDDRTRTWQSGAERLQITAGTAFLPPPGEAARIRSLQGGGEADEASRNMLIELGYIEEDEGGEDHGHGGDPDADASDSGASDVGSEVPNCY